MWRRFRDEGSVCAEEEFVRSSASGFYYSARVSRSRLDQGKIARAIRKGRAVRPVVQTQAKAGMMDAWLLEYLPILIFLGIAVVVGVFCVAASWLAARQKPDKEKDTAYECGFDAFGDARSKFDVRYYLVAILFIIFDLEVAFLFPWAVSLGRIGIAGFWSMLLFLGVLTVGFIYEWRKGALEWE
jgi:NADH-quinone oxidoreductase subunit A